MVEECYLEEGHVLAVIVVPRVIVGVVDERAAFFRFAIA